MKKFIKKILIILGIIGTGIVICSGLQFDTSFEDLPNVEKDNGIYKITIDEWSEIEIKDQNTPEIKMKKWEEECYMILTYPTLFVVPPQQNNGQLQWINTNKEIYLYPDDNTLSIEIVLKEKPSTNTITFNMESYNLDFFYQPELTQEEIDQGAFRPENVVGSYAVYRSENKIMFSIEEEAEKYKTGKVFHIYRPKIVDDEGFEGWGELFIDSDQEIYRIIIPDFFYNSSTYPIIIK